MTRRHLFDLTAAGLVGIWECSPENMRLKLVSMAERRDLVIVPIMGIKGLMAIQC